MNLGLEAKPFLQRNLRPEPGVGRMDAARECATLRWSLDFYLISPDTPLYNYYLSDTTTTLYNHATRATPTVIPPHSMPHSTCPAKLTVRAHTHPA